MAISSLVWRALRNDAWRKGSLTFAVSLALLVLSVACTSAASTPATQQARSATSTASAEPQPGFVTETPTAISGTPTAAVSTPLIPVPSPTATSTIILAASTGPGLPFEPDPLRFAASRPDDLFSSAVALPDLARLAVTSTGNGRATVDGVAGAIPAAYPVYVVSQNTGHGTLTRSSADGSFSADIIAPPGSWIIVKYDPTGGQWLDALSAEDPRPTAINAAPGVTVRVPGGLPTISGAGTPFVQAGTLLGNHTDFSIAGTMNGDFTPGGVVRLQGEITLYVSQSDVAGIDGQSLDLNVLITPVFDADGQHRTIANQFYSSILTPTGLPVEHWEGPVPAGGLLSTGPLSVSATSTGQINASFSFELPLPSDLDDGIYGLWLETFADVAGSLGEFRYAKPAGAVAHRAVFS